MRKNWMLAMGLVVALATACGKDAEPATTTTTDTASGGDATNTPGDATATTAGDATSTTAADTVSGSGDATGSAATDAVSAGSDATTTAAGVVATMVACLETSCKAEMEACKADAKCNAGFQCAQACKDCDMECMSTCLNGIGPDNVPNQKVKSCTDKGGAGEACLMAMAKCMK